MPSASTTRRPTSPASAAGCCWRSCSSRCSSPGSGGSGRASGIATTCCSCVGFLLIAATIALKATAGRTTLPFFLPTAAIAMLLAVLLDAVDRHVVIALVALLGGAVNGGSLEIATYIFLGGMAGIIAVRRGDRLQVFLQAGDRGVRRLCRSLSRSFSLLRRATSRSPATSSSIGCGSLPASAAGSGIAAVGSSRCSARSSGS